MSGIWRMEIIGKTFSLHSNSDPEVLAMFPDPLHPAIVHLPIALAVLIPVFAVLAAGLIYKNVLPERSWILVVGLQALLVLSSWIAVETGEYDEEIVESVVAEDLIEGHEEGAERFLLLTGVGLLAMGAGLLPLQLGTRGRLMGVVTSMAVLASAATVGHSGGELVYRHGAANAYISDLAPEAENASPSTRHDD